MDRYLAPKVRDLIIRANVKSLEEIRIRLERPLMVKGAAGNIFISPQGCTSPLNQAYLVTRDDFERTVQLITENSWYAWEEEIRNGYLTLPGGHRVGLGGRAVYREGIISTIKHLSSLNFRKAREVFGAADSVVKQVAPLHSGSIRSTLVISPPGCGKTTLLRDLTRQVANLGHQVCVIDERSELGSSYRGVPQLDLGAQTDVLDSYSKKTGVQHALRALAPDVVVTDEIGHEHDAWILAELARSGVKVMASCHGDSWDIVKKRSWAQTSLSVFELVIFLSRRLGPGTIESVLSLNNLA